MDKKEYVIKKLQEKIKEFNLPEKIEYVHKNIAPTSNDAVTDLKEYVKNYNDIFIKMDIEGEEFHWIRAFKDFFPKVKQFVFEAHVLFPHEVPLYWTSYHCKGVPADDWENYVLESLQILNETHRLVHFHENNVGPFIRIGDNNYPSFAELTFLRKDCEVAGFNTDILPLDKIDFPPLGTGDVVHDINFWPFKF